MYKKIIIPISESEVRKLRVGDQVLLSGTIFTARDLANKYLFEEVPTLELAGGCIYHCGPIILEIRGEKKVVAAGPTTSIRQEPFTPEIMKQYGLRVIIGKGGMGIETATAMKILGGVYLQAVGGAAQVLASKIKKIEDVFFLEFGEPEAMWKLAVEDFPAVVAMDSMGASLYAKIEADSLKRLNTII